MAKRNRESEPDSTSHPSHSWDHHSGGRSQDESYQRVKRVPNLKSRQQERFTSDGSDWPWAKGSTCVYSSNIWDGGPIPHVLNRKGLLKLDDESVLCTML